MWPPQPQMQRLSDFSGILRAAQGEGALWLYHVTAQWTSYKELQSPSLPGSPNLKVRCRVLCVDSNVQCHPICLLA